MGLGGELGEGPGLEGAAGSSPGEPLLSSPPPPRPPPPRTSNTTPEGGRAGVIAAGAIDMLIFGRPAWASCTKLTCLLERTYEERTCVVLLG